MPVAAYNVIVGGIWIIGCAVWVWKLTDDPKKGMICGSMFAIGWVIGGFFG